MPQTTETLSLGFETNPMMQGFRKVGMASKQFATKFSAGMDTISRKARKTGLVLSATLTAPFVLIGREMWKSVSQFEATQAKFSTVFGEMSDDMDAYLAKWKEITPVTRAQARSIASGIQDLLIPMGFARDEASGLTKDTLRLVGALANFNSDTRTAEEVAGAFTSALTGMFRPLKSLGINTEKLAVDQRAVAMGLAATTKEVTHQARAQALIAIATEQSQDALAAFNKESLDTKVRITIAMNALKDSFIAFSDSILPMMGKVAKAIKGVADWITSLTPEQRKWVMSIGAVLAALGPLALIISGVTFALAKLAIGVRVIGAAMTIATGPVGILVLGLTALGAVLVQDERFMSGLDGMLGKTSDTMRNKTIPVVEMLNFGLLTLTKTLVLIGRHVLHAFFSAGHWIREFGKVVVWTFKNIDKIAETMVENIKKYFTNLGGNLKNLAGAIKNFMLGKGWEFDWEDLNKGTENLWKDAPKMAKLRMAEVVVEADRALKQLDEKMWASKRRIDAALAGRSDMGSASDPAAAARAQDEALSKAANLTFTRVFKAQEQKPSLSAEKASLAVAGSLEAYRAEVKGRGGPDKIETATVETAGNTAESNRLLAKIAKNIGTTSFNGVRGIA